MLSQRPRSLAPTPHLDRTTQWASPSVPPQTPSQLSGSAGTDLFNLRQIECRYDETSGTLWSYMRPEGRPSYNPSMLRDFDAWQNDIEERFRDQPGSLRYLVLGSRFPKVFCLGGDLAHFVQRIRQRDRAALVRYGRACINILFRNLTGLGLPIVTIGLVQGDALGGGFESLLSFNVIVAEKGSRFGLPETVFGLFPGM